MQQDPLLSIRSFLTAQPELTTVTGGRIWADALLPSGYQVTTGPALLLNAASAVSVGQGNFLNVVSVQFLSYGATPALAYSVDGTLKDLLITKRRRSGIIRAVNPEQLGRPLREPTTLWPFYLSLYQFIVRTVEV